LGAGTGFEPVTFRL